MEQEYNTTPEETQRKVAEKLKTEKVSDSAKRKGKKAINKKASALQILKVQYVPVKRLKPNKYNPNRQSEHDFELLLKSMSEDGFTQPIVAIKDGTIVDGEHRWRAALTLGYDEIPVVFTEMTEEQMRIATLRHNRARDSEDIELSAQVLRDLQELGALDWAQDSLMLSDDEINRLLEDISAPDDLAEEEYSESWEPDQIMPDEEETDSSKVREIKMQGGGSIITAMSEKALADKRKREELIQKAKTEEERERVRKESNFYRLSLLFSGEEAVLVQKVLGDRPAERLIQICQREVTDAV